MNQRANSNGFLVSVSSVQIKECSLHFYVSRYAGSTYEMFAIQRSCSPEVAIYLHLSSHLSDMTMLSGKFLKVLPEKEAAEDDTLVACPIHGTKMV